jgi:metal-responsive CopG/Arc/MetJ family transcriptional regulator
MAKSLSGLRKKPRGPAERTSSTALQLPTALLSKVDAWANLQDDGPSRSEAVRRLIEQALDAAASPKRGKATARAASKMASRELENLADKSAPILEQEHRKRRLILGPKEFRDIRGDLPKSNG